MISILLAISITSFVADEIDPPTVLVVVGAPGAKEYEEPFRRWSERWRSVAELANADFQLLGDGTDDDPSDKQQLQDSLADQSNERASPLWLVLIGHGTFSGKTAKFNLHGPDVSAAELGKWLDEIQRPTIVVNCASASAPFINQLSADNRVLVTATKSGYEMNYARFGEHFSAALGDLDSDLDKDGQVSLLEAFLLASSRVREFYEQEARLSTETSLIDDNGDGLGTPATWFHGIHSIRQAKEGAALDGIRAHQFHLILSSAEREMPVALREQRDHLEQKIAGLRQKKETYANEDAYYTALEPLLLELAQLYQKAPVYPDSPDEPL